MEKGQLCRKLSRGTQRENDSLPESGCLVVVEFSESSVTPYLGTRVVGRWNGSET